jgi:hypothetical protein
MKEEAMVISHLGLGDMIGFSPAIRHFCERYKEVYIFSKEKNLKNVFGMYEDLDNLNIISIHDNKDEVSETFFYVQKMSDSCDIITSGIYNSDRSPFEELPDNFYKDVNLPLNVYETKFNLPKRIIDDTSLSFLLNDIDYNFIVGTSSTNNIDDKIISFIDNDYLIINPFKNHYVLGDDKYELAQKFINLPIFDYVNVIKNAREIHLIDSAFCLLCKFVSSEKTKKIVYNESGYTLSKNFFHGWQIR